MTCMKGSLMGGPFGPFERDYNMGLKGSKGCIRPITFFLAPINLGWAKHYNHGSMGHPPGSFSIGSRWWIVAAQWTRTKAEQ